MGRFTITHDFACDVETFWKTFFDRDFNVDLYTRVLGFPVFEILEQVETDTHVTRKVSAQPKMEVPGPLKGLVGGGLRYTEKGSLTRSEGIWRFENTPSTLADKIRISGAVRVEPAGAGKVRRTSDVAVEAKVFGVGGLIESTSEKQIRDAWGKSAAHMARYLEGRDANRP